VTENLETFEAPEGLSEIKFTTTVDVSYPYRDERDGYEVAVGYSPQKLCAVSGSLEELIETYKHTIISGEELAVRVGERVSDAIDLHSLRVEVKLLNAPFELQARATQTRK
jgi:NADPH-dependent 7-cyano-7-deazaguanine reductase QueF